MRHGKAGVKDLPVPIYVISLERDSGRRSVLESRFSGSWNQFQVVWAVDAQECGMDLELLPERFPRNPMTCAEKACALSHLKVYRLFLQSGSSSCIILEDDVEGLDSALAEAISVARSLPEGGMALLGGLQGLRNVRYVYGSPQRIAGVPAWRIPRICRRFISRACCYAITPDVARLLIAHQEKILHRADHWHELARDIKDLFCLDLFRHPEDFSFSRIEPGRLVLKQRSTIRRILADGIFYTTTTAVLKLFLMLFSRWLGMTRVKI